jgi:NTP pyrophosphatase (non-canonical NTP hydrolase)
MTNNTETTERNNMPDPPEESTLPAYQEYVGELVDRMGFTKDHNEVFIMLTEEVGELAKEVRRGWKRPEEARELAAGELADVFMYLCNVANNFGVDLDAAIRDKIKKNQTRHWDF